MADAAAPKPSPGGWLDPRVLMTRVLRGDVALALGILAILVMLILPMPRILLDMALAISISISVLVLMTALFIKKPLEFSAFPSVLLITTLLRLGLNIASTRLILSNGAEGTDAAGDIIAAFGAFVMQGNVVIGIIVFIILVIVNFVVITKGSGRIAEVAARFTLDAMPGKQMAIDADLSSGLISEDEARARRKELEGESNFFGAMDGASKFVRGDAGMVPDLMTRLYGSSDLFPDDRMHALRPWQSINYITSHDGFTMYDLVSYNHRRNHANGHGNTDGHDGYSWNCGWEGDYEVPAEVLALRKQQVKNLFCLLMLSNGTPMFRMGDEFLQTQSGNNNPYNQDNETSWLDWSRLETNRDIFRFVQQIIAFRKAHPSLCRNGFWRDDVRWHGTDRVPDLSHDSRAVAFCVHGASVRDDDVYVLINASETSLQFGIHEGHAGDWKRIVDTSQASPNDIVGADEAPVIDNAFCTVASRSVMVLVREQIIWNDAPESQA